MNIGKWLKRKMALLAFALSKTENSALGQREDVLDNIPGNIQTYNQGTLADALLKGEITLPVKELRWRLYKVLSESKGKAARIVGYDEDDMPIVETYTISAYQLDKIIRDDADSYPVEMVVKNTPLTKSTMEAFQNFDSNKINTGKEIPKNEDKYDLIGGEVIDDSFTHTEMSFDEMTRTFKDKKTIFVERELRPKFELERYTKKLLVRNISEDEKLLEFYVSQYVDDFNRKSRLFITEVKKAIKNPRVTDILDINKVAFISEKTIGVADGLEFVYEITKFDKIVEFNGSYVIKFRAKPIVNGEDVFEKYLEPGLEERYKNKEAK
jgi:hypothetical protein